MSAELGFFEDGDAVSRDFESAATRREQRDIGIGKTLSNLRRQTGSASFVASHRAVFDRDLHGSVA
jgi:hypothetical protein